jgi:predicted ATP-grasp superfamily ATP-dependent carboligase
VPRTWYPASPAELRDIDASPPFAVKPAIKEHFFYETGVKAWRAETREELAAVVARATAVAGPGEILVQELVPGGGTEQFSYCALVRAGSPRAVMTVRRRRQHPSDFGRASTYVETVDLPGLHAPSERFLASVAYDGLVELEYKKDPRDGRAKLLDVNARTWGYHSLGPAAGVDFPYLLYRDRTEEADAAADQPAAPVRTRPGVRWVRLATDVPNALRDVASGRQRLGAYLRTLPAADTEAVFDRRDPLPWFYECALLPYLAVRRGL